MGVDAGRCVPYVEQRRCGGRGGVAQLLGGADSCRRCGGVGLRPDARQLSVRSQVRDVDARPSPLLFANRV